MSHYLRRILTTGITVLLLLLLPHISAVNRPRFHEAPAFRNGKACRPPNGGSTTVNCDDARLPSAYLRGSIAAVLSVLYHSSCPESIIFHFLAIPRHHLPLRQTLTAAFPYLRFHLYAFNPSTVVDLISSSIRRALDQPLNYARIYLVNLLPSSINRIIYLDSDLIVVDDIVKLSRINLSSHTVGAPQYCHANFSHYFTSEFWSNPLFSATFAGRKPCYFSTGVMVIDLCLD